MVYRRLSAFLLAAAVMAAVLLFLTTPLAYLPTAAPILISSAIGLFDLASVRNYYRMSKPEFRHSVVATLGVMTVGVLPGVLIAMGLALLKLLRVVSHPRDAVLGVLDDSDGEYCVTEEEGGKTFPELIIYRFESPLLFFIADYFSDRVRTLIRNAETPPQSFLFGAEAVPLLDISGAFTLDSLRAELADKGILLAIARARGWFRVMLDRAGVTEKIGKENLFPTVHAEVRILRGNSDTISAKQPNYRIRESLCLCLRGSLLLHRHPRIKKTTEEQRHRDSQRQLR